MQYDRVILTVLVSKVSISPLELCWWTVRKTHGQRAGVISERVALSLLPTQPPSLLFCFVQFCGAIKVFRFSPKVFWTSCLQRSEQAFSSRSRDSYLDTLRPPVKVTYASKKVCICNERSLTRSWRVDIFYLVRGGQVIRGKRWSKFLPVFRSRLSSNCTVYQSASVQRIRGFRK